MARPLTERIYPLSTYFSGDDATSYFPLVENRVKDTIDQASATPQLRAILLEVLSRPGRILSSQTSPKWPAFVLDTCRALGGNSETAMVAATLVEFTIAATDVVDDLVDHDWDSEIVQGRALNASLALTWLAQISVSKLSRQLGPERALQINELTAAGVLNACAGEDLDIMFEPITNVSEEEAYRMTQLKAGSLVALACQVGAAVGIDEPEIIKEMGTFGSHVGTIAQLMNDLSAIHPGRAHIDSDLRRRKKTLPVSYALRCAHEEGYGDVLVWYQVEPTQSAQQQDEASLAAAMHELGAFHYTWVVAETHRRQALATLQALSATTGSDMVHQLQHLIPRISSI